MTNGLENYYDKEMLFFAGLGEKVVQIIPNCLSRKIYVSLREFEFKVVSKWVQNCNRPLLDKRSENECEHLKVVGIFICKNMLKSDQK